MSAHPRRPLIGYRLDDLCSNRQGHDEYTGHRNGRRFPRVKAAKPDPINYPPDEPLTGEEYLTQLGRR